MSADPHQAQEQALSELLPCPFCGGEATLRTRQDESLWSHNIVTHTSVGCDECDIAFATEPGYELEAPAAWNRRTDPPLARAVEVLEPFNDIAKLLESETVGAPDDEPLALAFDTYELPGLTFGDFRALAALLSDLQEASRG